MTVHIAPAAESRIAAGYGIASRRALTLAVLAIAGIGTLVVWGLSVLTA